MEVYLDVIFLENLVINYLILFVTAKFSKSKASSLRIFLGALLGAAYVVFLIVYPHAGAYYTMPAKILLSLAIIAAVFSPEKPAAFVKTLAIFYISTFIFAGAAFSFIYLNQSGGFVRNGIVYVFWNSKWMLIFLSIVTVGIITRIFWEVLQFRFVKEKLMIPLKIAFEDKIIKLAALIDTGNSLHDPLTDMPVVVVEFKAIEEILPVEIRTIFEDSSESDLGHVTKVISNSSWFSRFRLIPFNSLGKENGMLIGFKPDYIEIGEEKEKKGTNNVIVGIYNRALSRNETYRALLSPELIA